MSEYKDIAGLLSLHRRFVCRNSDQNSKKDRHNHHATTAYDADTLPANNTVDVPFFEDGKGNFALYNETIIEFEHVKAYKNYHDLSLLPIHMKS